MNPRQPQVPLVYVAEMEGSRPLHIKGDSQCVEPVLRALVDGEVVSQIPLKRAGTGFGDVWILGDARDVREAFDTSVRKPLVVPVTKQMVPETGRVAETVIGSSRKAILQMPDGWDLRLSGLANPCVVQGVRGNVTMDRLNSVHVHDIEPTESSLHVSGALQLSGQVLHETVEVHNVEDVALKDRWFGEGVERDGRGGHSSSAQSIAVSDVHALDFTASGSSRLDVKAGQIDYLRLAAPNSEVTVAADSIGLIELPEVEWDESSPGYAVETNDVRELYEIGSMTGLEPSNDRAYRLETEAGSRSLNEKGGRFIAEFFDLNGPRFAAAAYDPLPDGSYMVLKHPDGYKSVGRDEVENLLEVRAERIEAENSHRVGNRATDLEHADPDDIAIRAHIGRDATVHEVVSVAELLPGRNYERSGRLPVSRRRGTYDDGLAPGKGPERNGPDKGPGKDHGFGFDIGF